MHKRLVRGACRVPVSQQQQQQQTRPDPWTAERPSNAPQQPSSSLTNGQGNGQGLGNGQGQSQGNGKPSDNGKAPDSRVAVIAKVRCVVTTA